MKQESTQDEATREQIEVASEETTEATPQVTSTEEKATSERPRTEEEFRKIQSLKGKEEHRADVAEKALQSIQTELQGLRKFNEQQRVEARQKEIETLADDPDGQRAVRHKHQLEDDVRQLEQQRTDEEGAVQRKYDQAADLAKQYNLGLADARELLEATSPKEMELMAKLKATEQEKGQGKVQQGFKPDSATSDAAPSDFKQLEKNFIADPYKYGKAYKEALAKRGQ